MNADNKKKMLFLITIILICYSCSNSTKNKSEENVVNIVVEHENAEFNLYEVKPCLYHMLDTIIESTNACQKIKKENFIYCFTVDDSESTTAIIIELRDPKKLYCANFDGIFIYKKSVFQYSGKFLNDFFEFKNQKVKFRCRKPDQSMHDIDDTDFGSWHYILENKKLKCVSYGICDKSWVDEKYNKAHSF